MFKCICKRCGRIFEVRKSSLVSGDTTTCGKCMSYLVGNDPIKLGIYNAARGIIDRTTDIRRHDWRDYGGRGIKNMLGDDIVDAYRNLSKVPGFKPGLQIDRIDYNGHYTIYHPIYGNDIYNDKFGHKCLGNLRWVTPKFNSCNKRDSVALSLNKVSLALIPRSKRTVMRWITKHSELCNLGSINDYEMMQLKRMAYTRNYNGKECRESVYVALHNKIKNKCPRLYKLIMDNIQSLQTNRRFITPKFNELYLEKILPNIKPVEKEM